MGRSDDEASSEAAALNNAEWCASVWRSHGLDVERGDGLWFCRSETPKFYPNVVTVDPSHDPSLQTEVIREISAKVEFEFSVKDSFDSLPLDAAGFARVFSAYWLRRDFSGDDHEPQHGWDRVEPDQLENWESAWAGNQPDLKGIFRKALLKDRRVVILARSDAHGQVVAGAIIFEAGGVAGLTNVFGRTRGLFDAVRRWTSCRTVVAYEPGISAEAAVHRGFNPLTTLSVWRRSWPSVA